MNAPARIKRQLPKRCSYCGEFGHNRRSCVGQALPAGPFDARNEGYWHNRAHGLCDECGAPSDRSRCPTCAERRRGLESRASEYRHAFEYKPSRAKLRSIGFCENGREHGRHVDGRRCKLCALAAKARAQAKADRVRAKARAKRAGRIARGVCVDCGKRRAVGGMTCRPCRVRTRAYLAGRYAAFKARGLCAKCGGPRGTHAYCDSCRADARRRHHARAGP